MPRRAVDCVAMSLVPTVSAARAKRILKAFTNPPPMALSLLMFIGIHVRSGCLRSLLRVIVFCTNSIGAASHCRAPDAHPQSALSSFRGCRRSPHLQGVGKRTPLINPLYRRRRQVVVYAVAHEESVHRVQGAAIPPRMLYCWGVWDAFYLIRIPSCVSK